MTVIKNIGSYLKTDSQGTLIPIEITPNKKWLLIAREYSLKITSLFPTEIKTIYLRGSVVSDKAIENISDLDIVIVSFLPLSKEIITELQKVAEEMNQEFPFITRFDLNIHTYKKLLSNKENTHIKLGSILLYGEDFLDEILPKRPGEDVWIQLETLEHEIEKIIKDEYKTDLPQIETNDVCKWFMKRILRSGMELVSKQEKTFTRDLYRCWESFSKYYPNKSDDMYEVLQLAINPTNDIKVIQSFLPLAKFIIQEKNKVTNPNHGLATH